MSLLAQHDGLLVDLDGTVWNGDTAIASAISALNEVSVPVAFVTNNASKAHAAVAEKLRALGINNESPTVFNSVDAVVQLLQQEAAPGTTVLVVGTAWLQETIAEAGYRVVTSAGDEPVNAGIAAVVQGHNPENGWAQLSEIALAVRAGARYVLTNADTSLPTERGFYLGNGAMAAAVTASTGVHPRAAGKPEPELFHLAAQKIGAKNPLCIGDRLNTDIAGANNAGFASLHVLTGVSGAIDLLEAPPEHRPTYIGVDLADVLLPAEQLRPGAQNGFTARGDGHDVLLERGSIEGHGNNAQGQAARSAAALRTVLEVAWAQPKPPRYIHPRSEFAEKAVDSWN
ncbi:HAD-IIA family hydrolase [Corynebacterium pseudodiphtheriticum]|uniref:HAD-IIA family hydrolase n=1 Tax=Corynebacterium pseudodiphtheriticum TaxID=37637 RepID=UPI00254A8C45|nr:HAD-IIA family hydrolase [Corynebacterium pseudodiphtheriticum]MDK8477281.1 HAD-IIA family hydrolase [Corynebacterium pseudodiphtheriticum]MDK8485587.1 HAD-IIA family hydrolase [Corynebacterium pseudodiphtheriticum]MDK8492820.1 HAD-IIA family hydrolase [Corynebacterium pseudodiphtheriticum]